MKYYIFDNWDFGATHLVGVRASSRQEAFEALRSILDSKEYPGYAHDMLCFEGEGSREEYLACDECF